MNLSELIQQCREDSDDLNAPFLVSDESFTSYLNQAVTEACRRAFLLYDEDTDEDVDENPLCLLPLIAGTNHYTLHPSILRVESVRRVSDNVTLYRMPGLQRLDENRIIWRNRSGRPTGFAIRRRQMFLDYSPIDAEDLALGVMRLPLAEEQMADDIDEPAIPAVYHPHLIYWALWRAYRRRDAELRSERGAAENLALFDKAFGLPISAKAAENMAEQSSAMTARTPPYGASRTQRLNHL